MVAGTTTFVLAYAFAQISLSLSMPTLRPATVGYIISLETGRFLSFHEDGTVKANGNLHDEETSINVEYLAGNHVRLQYVMPNKDCYLVFENGQFRGSNPKMGNELFEIEEVGSSYALRLVNYDTASAGMGANETNMTSEGSTNTTEGLNNATEGGMNTTESSEAPVDTTDGPNDTTEGPTDTTEPSEGLNDTTEEPTGTTDEPSEGPTRCYLGFSDADSEPRCYASVDFAATRFLIIH